MTSMRKRSDAESLPGACAIVWVNGEQQQQTDEWRKEENGTPPSSSTTLGIGLNSFGGGGDDGGRVVIGEPGQTDTSKRDRVGVGPTAPL